MGKIVINLDKIKNYDISNEAYEPIQGRGVFANKGYYDDKTGAFTSVLIETNKISNNQTYYSKDLIDKHIRGEKIVKALENGKLYGETEHPLLLPSYSREDRVARNSFIDDERVSHKISNIWWEDNKLCGEIIPMKSYKFGKQLLDRLETGEKISFSIRTNCITVPVKTADGSTYLNKIEPFQLITFDVVKEPSLVNSNIEETDKKFTSEENDIKKSNESVEYVKTVFLNSKNNKKKHTSNESIQMINNLYSCNLENADHIIIEDGDICYKLYQNGVIENVDRRLHVMSILNT